MLDAIAKIMNGLETLKSKKNPQLAALIGLALGGIGLGIYFRSIVDAVIPVGIAIAVILVVGEPGFIAGVIISALYGYFRAVGSNARLAQLNRPANLDPHEAY